MHWYGHIAQSLYLMIESSLHSIMFILVKGSSFDYSKTITKISMAITSYVQISIQASKFTFKVHKDGIQSTIASLQKKITQNIFIQKLLHAKLQIVAKGFEHIMYKAINSLLLCWAIKPICAAHWHLRHTSCYRHTWKHQIYSLNLDSQTCIQQKKEMTSSMFVQLCTETVQHMFTQ